jgi:TonB family protein
MRLLCFLALIFAGVLPGFGQAASAGPGLPKDPREVFAMAAPFYDFSSPELKPWHLKATYQLYDEKGKPSEQGIYEYWWASPKVYRSTWTRPGATHTDWYTADGKHWSQATGKPIEFFERSLSSMLLSPLPSADELDPAKAKLSRETVKLGGLQYPCIIVEPHDVTRGPMTTSPLGIFPTYCFDPQSPVLRFRYASGAMTTVFDRIAKVQGRYLPFEFQLLNGRSKILDATVNTVAGLAPSDPALTPSTAASIARPDEVQISAGVAVGNLVKKEAPPYPQDAKGARVSGTVVLQAKIGLDGKVRELHVVSSPSFSLAASAIEAVSHWEYKPFKLNGEPVEVETIVNVIFELGG